MTLTELSSDPAATALLLDVDGTLAPIVEDPAAAQVPPATAGVLADLAERYLLIACISGRRALEARRIVGLGQLTYAGNHGLELLSPGAVEPALDPRVADFAQVAEGFVEGLDWDALEEAGIWLEDKGPIQALHWRGAPRVAEAVTLTGEVAVAAQYDGLSAHRGRMVLELRPPVEFGKDAVVRELVSGAGATAALYAGDDRTDLDAFRALRELVREGMLTTAVCVGVASDEGPEEIRTEADVVVASPEEFAELLRSL